MSIPCWWKYEMGESLEMVQSYLDESDECIDENEWVDSLWGKEKMYKKIKNNINKVVKKDVQIKEVIEDITSDITKW